MVLHTQSLSIADSTREVFSPVISGASDTKTFAEGDELANGLLHLANKDPITMLPNRFWLMNYLRKIINDACGSETVMALIFVDLEEFRNIKYTFGHVFSDELLCQVGLRLSAILKPGDYVARLGYGEFAFILNDVVHADEVRHMADQISFSLSMPFDLPGERHHTVQASIGISIYPQDAHDGEALLEHADIAMYAAKAHGNEQYLFYQGHMAATILAKITIGQALRDALERNEFILYYQPRVDSYTGELRGLEALVRWNHPERGLVTPQEFIPIAEASDLIVRLGERVIEIVCQQLAAWKMQGLPSIPVSINVSPRQLNRNDLMARILRHTTSHGIDPAMLEIEVTESCIIEHDLAAQQLASFSALGMKLLLDDFGTGYSSLSQLRQFEMDVLKVDRTFIANLQEGHRSEALVSAIITMAHALGMEVIAEGVETLEQLRLLQTFSCNEVQGYLISKPVPADAMAALMRKTSLFSDEIAGGETNDDPTILYPKPLLSGSNRATLNK